MDQTLVSLLQIEGAAKDKVDLDGRLADAGLLIYAMRNGYYQAMATVVMVYKPAAAMRVVKDGVNTSAESIARFRACSERFLAILDAESRTGAPSIVKALIMHNAASCLAAGNGNKPEDQAVLNEAALGTLHAVWGGDPSVRESADWHAVNARVMIGLYEHGGRPFDEIVYRRFIESLERFGSKDAAGRRLFLARWLEQHGRRMQAITVLEAVETADYVSAADQIENARAYLTLMSARSDRT